MKTLKFKTNVNCICCVERIKSVLSKKFDQHQWDVDLESPLRILTVRTDVPPYEIERMLEKAGYLAVSLEELN